MMKFSIDRSQYLNNCFLTTRVDINEQCSVLVSSIHLFTVWFEIVCVTVVIFIINMLGYLRKLLAIFQ